jgi:thioredoxin 1
MNNMIAYITELNEQNYKSFTESGLVLVDIKTDWCGPCKVIGPLVDQVSADYVGKLSVGKLDADSLANKGVEQVLQESLST